MVNQETRRGFLKASAVVPLRAAFGVSAIAAHAAIAAEPPNLAAARKRAQGRRRRLIYNDDGCGPLGQPGGGTPDGFLYGPHSRMIAVRGTQIDSVFINSGATHVLNHPSAVAESYADVAQRYGIGGEWETYRANMRALEALQTDAIQLTIDFCRQHKLEVFYSHRINDIHNTFLAVERSTWFRAHPQFWMGHPQEAAKAGGGNSPKHWWSALDFEQPEVLDYLGRIQEDVCGRYDVDGVEIDYFRSPMFFRPNLEFQPATAAQIEILTRFQRRLRAIHLQASTKRGRPILTAARVPAVPAACRHVGIDIERWLQEGLVDVLTVGGGYVPFTEPLDEIVKMSHDVGVPVYPTISSSGMRGGAGRYRSVEGWRGAAANIFHAGADGIVTFNLFPTGAQITKHGPEPRFLDLGSEKTLAGKNKLFVIDPIRILEGDLVQAITQTQALPLTIPANGQAAVTSLPIGDDLANAAKNGTLASADLRIRLSDPKAVGAVEVSLNGKLLAATAKAPAANWLVFQPDPTQYRRGGNELSFRSTRVVPDTKILADVTLVEVPVFYK